MTSHRNEFEFRRFLTSPIDPDSSLDAAVRRSAELTLSPSLPATFAKAFAIYFIGSLLTLSLCPQFGIAFTSQTVIMDTLMAIHPALCFLACGAIWISGGYLIGHIVLSWDERLLLNRNQAVWGFSFISLSMIGFASFGELQVDQWLGLWVGGAVLAIGVFRLWTYLSMRKHQLGFLPQSGHQPRA